MFKTKICEINTKLREEGSLREIITYRYLLQDTENEFQRSVISEAGETIVFEQVVGCWPVDFVSSTHVLVMVISNLLIKKKKKREEECVSSFSQLGDVFLLLNENTTK